MTAIWTPFGEDLARACLGSGELECEDPRPTRVFQWLFENEDRDDGECDHRDTEQDQPLLAGHREDLSSSSL